MGLWLVVFSVAYNWMKITIVRTGYIGLVTGTCFSGMVVYIL